MNISLRHGNFLIINENIDGFMVCCETEKISKKTGRKVKKDRRYYLNLSSALKDLSRRILSEKLNSEEHIPTLEGMMKTLKEHFEMFNNLTRGL